jgi:hypothetical protein
MERNLKAVELSSARAHSVGSWDFLAPLAAAVVILLLNSLGPGSAVAVLIGSGLTVVGVVDFLRSPGTVRDAEDTTDGA